MCERVEGVCVKVKMERSALRKEPRQQVTWYSSQVHPVIYTIYTCVGTPDVYMNVTTPRNSSILLLIEAMGGQLWLFNDINGLALTLN